MVSTFFLISCSIDKMVIDFAQPIVDGGITALFQETDTEFAQYAMAANIKLLEGFLITDPENSELLANAAMGFAAYSLGYLEDTEPERAKEFYIRSMNYGLKALRQNSDFAENENEHFQNFEASLDSFDEDDVPALFWTALAWGLHIRLNLDKPESIVLLSKSEALMKRVYQLNPSYFGGGPDIFFGVIECVKPPIAGGDPARGKAHFEKALKISNNDFLITKAFMAQYYCPAVFDEELFDQLSEEVLKYGNAKNINFNLPNALAKKKIRYLMTQKDDLF